MWWIILVAAVFYIIIKIFIAIDFRKIRINDNDYNVDDYMSDRMGLFLFVGAAFYFPIFIVDMVYDRRYLKELREDGTLERLSQEYFSSNVVPPLDQYESTLN